MDDSTSLKRPQEAQTLPAAEPGWHPKNAAVALGAKFLQRILDTGKRKPGHNERAIEFAAMINAVFKRRMAPTWRLKDSALLASEILENVAMPTACKLCVVIAELEHAKVDAETLKAAHRCLRDAIEERRIGDMSMLVNDDSKAVFNKAMEEIRDEAIDIHAPVDTHNIEVTEIPYEEYLKAIGGHTAP